MRGSSAARFPYPRDQAGFLRCAPQDHRVVRHPVRRYDGSATAPPSVKGFGSHLLSTDARSCCLLGAPCRIRTLLTIRWISGKARAGEFLITLLIRHFRGRELNGDLSCWFLRVGRTVARLSYTDPEDPGGPVPPRLSSVLVNH